MLRPQDLAVALLLTDPSTDGWTYATLADRLAMSTSEAHAAVKRAQHARLLRGRAVDRRALLAFVEHGLPHAFYAERGAPTRGIATGASAPPLDAHFAPGQGPVWPDPDGDTRGYALKPLYPRLPQAARRDHVVHELFSLVDAVRDGGVREKSEALRALRTRIERDPGATPDE
ncbi:MAG: hypothetical protein ABR510_12470 [Trueperaceae bacterium]